MCTITATEFKENFGKYMKLGQKEEIDVTHRGDVIFTIVPKKERLKKEWASIFGSLRGEIIDDDVDRE